MANVRRLAAGRRQGTGSADGHSGRGRSRSTSARTDSAIHQKGAVKIFGRKPALIIAWINSLLALLIVFGLNLRDARTAAIVAFANAVMAIWTRSKVTPVVY